MSSPPGPTIGLVMDPYQTDQWHDFFLAAAGAAAALTGLLFVALSLHVRYIATNPAYRLMARGSLIGLVMALLLSLLVLVRQPIAWLGVELGSAGFLYLAVIGGHQLYSLERTRWRIARGSLVRSVVGYALALAGLVTGVALAVRAGPGLYVLASIVVVIMLWNLWDAWTLLIGVADEEMAKSSTP